MKRFGLLLFFLVSMLSGSVQAQNSYSEIITSFDSEITITEDNQAQIKETIAYDFGLNDKHGIYRYVPTRTIAGDTGKFYYYTLEWGEVLQDGVQATVEQDDNDDFGFIRIGDADKTISGSHVYEINYTLSPIAEQEPGGDYINLNITGNDWAAPISSVTADISIESGSKVLELRCYTGPTGSTAQDCTTNKANNNAAFGTDSLGAYEGLTVNLLTESNHFASYLAPQDPPPPDLKPFGGLVIGLAAFVLGVGLRIRYKLEQRRRKNDQTIIPQYEPPKDLTIGEIGVMHDNSADMKEITATLIDLAVRGYIKIKQLNKKTWFKSAQYQFDLLKSGSGLNTYEQSLVDLLFAGNSKTVNLKDVSKTQAGPTVSSVKSGFVKLLEEKGCRTKTSKLASHRVIEKIYIWLGAAIFFWTIAIWLMEAANSDITGDIVFMTVVGCILLAFGYGLSMTIHITDKGYAKWAEIEGLIMYLTVAEKDRLAFLDAPEKTPEHFSALLPAAVALGVDKQWANQFKDLDIAENVNWYSGPNSGFNSVVLASSLSHDLNSTVASSFTPPSQSSGGSGGGGFSGGGGGGGGGGSW